MQQKRESIRTDLSWVHGAAPRRPARWSRGQQLERPWGQGREPLVAYANSYQQFFEQPLQFDLCKQLSEIEYEQSAGGPQDALRHTKSAAAEYDLKRCAAKIPVHWAELARENNAVAVAVDGGTNQPKQKGQ